MLVRYLSTPGTLKQFLYLNWENVARFPLLNRCVAKLGRGRLGLIYVVLPDIDTDICRHIYVHFI